MPKPQQKQKEDEFVVGSTVELTDGLKGTIKYIGRVKGSNGKNKKGIFYGVELTEAKGKNDGYINGRSYFMTKPYHGVFIKLERIKCKTEIVENKRTKYTANDSDEDVLD